MQNQNQKNQRIKINPSSNSTSSTSPAPNTPQLNELSQKKKFTPNEIKMVQNLIERCLRLYMTQEEAITALHIYQNIEPNFITLVWNKLEEQNPDFFKAYGIRLKVREQITEFNFLVSQHAVSYQKQPVNSLKKSLQAQQTIQKQQNEQPLYSQFTTDFFNEEYFENEELDTDFLVNTKLDDATTYDSGLLFDMNDFESNFNFDELQ
eukprot:gene5492-9309_t